MEGAATPLHLQVVVKLAFKYGVSAEEYKHSFAYARVNAFASSDSLNKSFDCVGLGSPIQGILELTASGYNSSRLIGWLFP